jgi:2-oxoglutarate ferredoxin oxidoreductase subunit beta
VTFNNQDTAMHSYTWGKEHEVALHELSYVPRAEEIMVEYEEGEAKEVTMHDGSTVVLKKLGKDYDPTNRSEALRVLEEANAQQVLVTGLIYINTEQPSLREIYNLTHTPLNRLTQERIRPSQESIQMVNDLMF